MVVTDGSRVKIEFTATYPHGELFDTSSRAVAVEHDADTDDKRFRPIVVEIGADPTVESLDAGLRGLAVGDTATIEVPHDELVVAYDRDEFESMVEGEVRVGRQVHAETGLLGEVVEVEGEEVVVDFDPEHAREVLTFEVEVTEIE